jgi:predicted dehydrogenase
MERRTFLMSSVGAVSASAAASAAKSPNDTVRVAVLGTRGRGQNHMQGFSRLKNVQVVAFADPDLKVARSKARDFEGKTGQKVKVVQDLRRIFDDKDIDVVSVATPNHWHSLATIWACQAGKDVYVEKPGSHNVFEGRKMVEAASKYNRIVQHGVQLRSSPALQEAVQLMRDGYIGKIYMSRAIIYRWRPSIGKKDTIPVPADLDYNLWQGPAQEEAYSERLVHYNWHYSWEHGNGEIGNQGVHETDMSLWGLDEQMPRTVQAMGGRFLWDDDKETPEVINSTFLFDSGKYLEVSVRHWCTNEEDGVGVGNIFYGDKGYLVVKGYSKYQTFFGRKREPGKARDEGGNHYANFIDAVRSRKTSDQNGPVETAHYSSAIAHLGNISYRLGRRLEFDPKKEKFIGDAEADKHLTRNYRAPFVVPEKV